MDFEKDHYFCPSPATGTNFISWFFNEMVRPEKQVPAEVPAESLPS
jgi:hypothetical protein